MSGRGDELRALLVRAGELVAPKHFRVALGDVSVGGETEEGENNGKKGKQGEEDEEAKKAAEEEEMLVSVQVGVAGDMTALRGYGGEQSVLSTDSDSKHSILDEGGGGGDVGGGGEERERGRMEGYQLAKEQVLAHKGSVGADQDADRYALYINKYNINTYIYMCLSRFFSLGKEPFKFVILPCLV